MKLDRIALLVVLLTALTASTAMARKAYVTLGEDAYVGEVKLAKGRYEVQVAPGGDSVSFVQRRQAVATVGCTVSALPQTYKHDALVYRAKSERPQITGLMLASVGSQISLR